MEEKKIKIIRRIIAIIVLILFIAFFVKMLPQFINLTTEEGREAFQKNTEELGLKGVMSILTLEICKIILVFLPGEPIELLAGMCYGAIGGLLLIYLGVIISNIIIIYLVKKFGTKLVDDVVPEDKRKKIEGMINENPNRSEIALIILYFLPALPKDFITYIASLLPISYGKIMIISLICRFPAVFSSVLVGSKIVDGKLTSIIIIYLITYIISGLVVYIYNQKRKEIKSE